MAVIPLQPTHHELRPPPPCAPAPASCSAPLWCMWAKADGRLNRRRKAESDNRRRDRLAVAAVTRVQDLMTFRIPEFFLIWGRWLGWRRCGPSIERSCAWHAQCHAHACTPSSLSARLRTAGPTAGGLDLVHSVAVARLQNPHPPGCGLAWQCGRGCRNTRLAVQCARARGPHAAAAALVYVRSRGRPARQGLG